MMKYHRKKAHIESFVTNEFYSTEWRVFVTNEFYSTEWRVFPIEIIALIRYRYLKGKSINFINHEVLSKFVPYLQQKEYYASSIIEKTKSDIYKLFSVN
ncbi:hypothetical protein DWY45_14420 [Phocaeicola plebeius]|nr:hypothetical protein DWY45_14420 [Phocaeicola plebeius]